jgi:hypothetical protein
MTVTLNLPVAPLSNLNHPNASAWNIINVGHGANNSNQAVIVGASNVRKLQVLYPAGSYCPSAYPSAPVGGIGFAASPSNILMADNVSFGYNVYFDDTFQPVLGGKLPGLFIGTGTTSQDVQGAAGGDHSTGNSSVRIVWRTNLLAEAYVYHISGQHSSYSLIPNLYVNNTYGDSLWRGLFEFKKHQWNPVHIQVKMNSVVNGVPKYDGVLAVSINGIVYKYTKMLWRTSTDYHVNAIMFGTFFGGSTSNWATPVNTSTYFKDISITKY